MENGAQTDVTNSAQICPEIPGSVQAGQLRPGAENTGPVGASKGAATVVRNQTRGDKNTNTNSIPTN